jgi:hypothetical protein
MSIAYAFGMARGARGGTADQLDRVSGPARPHAALNAIQKLATVDGPPPPSSRGRVSEHNAGVPHDRWSR